MESSTQLQDTSTNTFPLLSNKPLGRFNPWKVMKLECWMASAGRKGWGGRARARPIPPNYGRKFKWNPAAHCKRTRTNTFPLLSDEPLGRFNSWKVMRLPRLAEKGGGSDRARPIPQNHDRRLKGNSAAHCKRTSTNTLPALSD